MTRPQPRQPCARIRVAAAHVRALDMCGARHGLPQTVVRYLCWELGAELPAVLRARDARRLAAIKLRRDYVTALLKAFDDDAIDTLEAAVEVLRVLPPPLARQSVQAWGKHAPSKIRADPYGAMHELRVDKRAADQALESIVTDPRDRLRGRVAWMLRDAEKDGHTALPLAEVEARLGPLGLDATTDPACVHGLVMTAKTLAEETFLADAIRQRLRAAPPPLELPAAAGEGLAADQVAAVELVGASGVSVVTGPPGTGKSTVVRALVDAVGPRRCMLTAPTGRAARNIGGSTLHRAELAAMRVPLQETSKSDVPADLRLMIVDEASMLTNDLMLKVLRLAPPACRIVLVGDVDQLPPVGVGDVFATLLEHLPAATLRTQHRCPGGVLAAAAAILRGEAPAPNEDVSIVRPEPGGPSGFALTLREFRPERQCHVLAPTNSQRVALNRAVQSSLRDVRVTCRMLAGGPARLRTDPATGRASLVSLATGQVAEAAIEDALAAAAKEVEYGVGDLVMVLKNQKGGAGGACNGDIGTFVSGDAENVNLRLRGRVVRVPRDQTDLAYAATVHKFQGSECEDVVLPVYAAASAWDRAGWDRHMLYTAVTRARGRVALVGSAADLEAVVARVRPPRRSALDALLRALLRA